MITVAVVFNGQTLPTDLGMGPLLALAPATLSLLLVDRLDRIEPEPEPGGLEIPDAA